MNKVDILREYQKKVVDLSRRNRLLKYPKNARGLKFDITLEEFQERFGRLEEITIDFTHRDILDSENANGSLFEEQVETEKEEIYIPPTNPSGEKLLSSLSALRLDTKRKLEEHGLYTLFLTIGRVKWKQPLAGRGSSDATKNTVDYDSPLLLVPIEIKEVRSPRKRTTITSCLDAMDITINPVLLLLIELEYGIKLPEIENDFSNLSEYISKLKKLLVKTFKEANIDCEISDEIQIGQYSFYGQQIYEDLKENEGKLVENEFISSLCGNEQLVQGGLDNMEPEDLLKKEEDYNVLDADVSQLRVVQQIISGKNLIVQGPPGTGKSQTIVNAVSNLLARGKTVLVVCEKQVALEVVYQRLKNKGLERLCLPLFHHNSDKKQFAKTIIEDRDYLIRNYAGKGKSGLHSSLECRDETIDCLRSYAKALGTIVSPLEKSVYWVHGELSKAQSVLNGVMLPWKGENPLLTTEKDYRKAINLIQNVSEVLDVVYDKKHSHWKAINKTHFSPDFMARVQAELRKIESAVSKCGAIVDKLAVIQTISDIRHCIFFSDSFEKILHVKNLSLPINTEADIREATKNIDEILELVTEYQEFKNSLEKKYITPLANDFFLIYDGTVSINKKTSIQQCKEASKYSNSISDNINSIKTNAISMPFVLEMPINEVVKNSEILFINPIIRRLNNWNEISFLKKSLEMLEPLSIVYGKIDDAKKVINAWAILTADFNWDEASEVVRRFEESYHNFFRNFSRQYKKDCKIIEGWCNSETPKTYGEYLQIVEAIGNRIKLKEKVQILLEKFTNSEIVAGQKLNEEEIPILYSQIKRLVDWMYQENQQELPQRISKIIESGSDIHVLREISRAFIEIQSILDDAWNIFPIEKENLSINKLSELEKEYVEYVSSILLLNEKVCRYTNDCSPVNISDLEKDSETLNQLGILANRLAKLNPQLSLLINKEDNLRLFDSIEVLQIIKDALEDAIALIEGLQEFSGEEVTIGDAIWFVDKINKSSNELRNDIDAFDDAVAELDVLFESDDSMEHLEDFTFSNFIRQIKEMLCDGEGLEGWMTYRKYASQLEEMGHGWFLETMPIVSGNLPAALFSQSLWSAWLATYYSKNEILSEFNVNLHSQTIEAFIQYEKEVLNINAERILRKRVSDISQAKMYGGMEERFLIKQSQLKRSHKPVRQVVMQCSSHLQQYKPCWMMSPLTLSSYIPYGEVEFDVVIFDEASQMRVEHALTSISRAKQVVIFGDEHQLPPTSFFQSQSDTDDEEAEESQDFESILHASKTILPAADVSLLYHYRSKFEDLIAFSNHHIYKDELITFPNPGAGIKGVEFEYVADGVFDGGKEGTRRNLKEAERVIQMCVKSVTDSPNKSIGVIAFSKSQEVAIRDTLIQWLKDNPNSELSAKLDENSEGPEEFFIKNLESVQGDERDIIILSIGYGRDKNGKVFNRFGPINGPYGYRRLNVAVTRAKEKIICVSSLKAHDINPSESSRGGKMLQHYLDYAENGIKTLESGILKNGVSMAEADSEFELDVQSALECRGYVVDRQIGASGFRIDLAILNPKNNQEYLLGIECDGASYHSSYSARINDRLRQEILEGLGWKIYRVWSQHWLSHKDAIVEDIIKCVEKC